VVIPPTVSGDSSLFGNAELRLWLGRRKAPILPLRWGLMAFTEAGRVWYQGEGSDTWHSAYGGGVLMQPIGFPITISASLAQSREGLHFYFKGGYSF
jgi:outer membrane translocation and assembly module TamA